MDVFKEQNKSLPLLNNLMIRASNNIITEKQTILNSNSAANLNIMSFATLLSC
jgi:hypothetical protein